MRRINSGSSQCIWGQMLKQCSIVSLEESKLWKNQYSQHPRRNSCSILVMATFTPVQRILVLACVLRCMLLCLVGTRRGLMH